MTRINVGVHPEELPSKLLLAEHREITRIPNMVASGRARLIRSGAPDRFTLGTGHVKFFYFRLGYLLDRYRAIYAECKRRGFNVQDRQDSWDSVPKACLGSYTPCAADRQLIVDRIQSKGFELLLLRQ